MLLAIISNTLFSVGLIILLSAFMYNQPQLFCKVSTARNYMAPLIRRSIIPVILVEIFLHFAYQLPLD